MRPAVGKSRRGGRSPAGEDRRPTGTSADRAGGRGVVGLFTVQSEGVRSGGRRKPSGAQGVTEGVTKERPAAWGGGGQRLGGEDLCAGSEEESRWDAHLIQIAVAYEIIAIPEPCVSPGVCFYLLKNAF